MLTLTGNFVAQNEYIASGLLTAERGAVYEVQITMKNYHNRETRITG